MARVLFVCIGNAGRSPMAAALLERAAGDRHEARSAGTHPEEVPHPNVVSALAELGVDLRGHRPRGLASGDVAWADVVVTMGCGAIGREPGAEYRDWAVDDPIRMPVPAVRAVRDDVARRVDGLVADLDAAAQPS